MTSLNPQRTTADGRRSGLLWGWSGAAIGVLVALLVIAAAIAAVPVIDQWLPGRTDLDGHRAEWISQSDRLIADPPGDATYPPNNPLFFRVSGRERAIVGWMTDSAIPARNWGYVYDPSGLVDSGAQFEPYGGFVPYLCERIDGPWYYCRFN